MSSRSERKYKITALLIAAGLSSRIGKFKPLIEYNGKSFITTISEKILSISDSLVVVTGYKADLIENELSNNNLSESISTVVNGNINQGMFSSIKIGLRKINSEWILLHQIDQPNLPLTFYGKFVDEIDGNFSWIQPVYNSQKGHPILFNQDVKKKIMQAESNSNLRLISSQFDLKKKLWECSYNQIHTDVDTPDDLIKLGKQL